MKHLITVMLVGMLLCTVGCFEKEYKTGEEPKVGDRVKLDNSVGTVVSVSGDKTNIKVKYGQTEEDLKIEEYSTGDAILVSKSLIHKPQSTMNAKAWRKWSETVNSQLDSQEEHAAAMEKEIKALKAKQTEKMAAMEEEIKALKAKIASLPAPSPTVRRAGRPW